MKLIQVKESENVVCPYCEKTLVEANEESYQTCKHTIFIAADEDWIEVRDDYKHLISAYNKQEEDEFIGEFTSKLTIEGTHISHFDASINIYWGFVND